MKFSFNILHLIDRLKFNSWNIFKSMKSIINSINSIESIDKYFHILLRIFRWLSNKSWRWINDTLEHNSNQNLIKLDLIVLDWKLSFADKEFASVSNSYFLGINNFGNTFNVKSNPFKNSCPIIKGSNLIILIKIRILAIVILGFILFNARYMIFIYWELFKICL